MAEVAKGAAKTVEAGLLVVEEATAVHSREPEAGSMVEETVEAVAVLEREEATGKVIRAVGTTEGGAPAMAMLEAARLAVVGAMVGAAKVEVAMVQVEEEVVGEVTAATEVAVVEAVELEGGATAAVRAEEAAMAAVVMEALGWTEHREVRKVVVPMAMAMMAAEALVLAATVVAAMEEVEQVAVVLAVVEGMADV